MTPVGLWALGWQNTATGRWSRAAASWSGGNIVARQAGNVNMLCYVVWASLFSIPPLFALSLWLEGWSAMVHGVRSADALTWVAVLWQAVGNTMLDRKSVV